MSRRRGQDHDPDALPPELARFEPESWPPYATEVGGAPVPEYVLRYYKIHGRTRARATWATVELGYDRAEATSFAVSGPAARAAWKR